MTTLYHIDYESRSTVDLAVRGLHNYVTDSTTEVILAAYAEGDHKPKLWEPHRGPMPAELREALEDPCVTVVAWNCSFEHGVTEYRLGIEKPLEEFYDAMVHARFLSLPGALEDVGKIVGLPQDEQKMTEGKRLIKKFCEPCSVGGRTTLFGTSKTVYRDWDSDPEDWALFCDYVKRDVIAERSILKKLAKWPLPGQEQADWVLDQRINERGLPVNLNTVRGAKFIADKEMARLGGELRDLTGLSNANSNDQMLGFLKEQGYTFSSLGKAFVARALGGECPLTDLARKVLEIRKMTSKSSVGKFQSILDNVNEDGRVRHQFTFFGAPRTGRWSGRDVQLQNLPRPTKAVEKNLDCALDLVRKMDYDGIVTEFGQPLEVASSVIRSAFCASPGKKLLIADLSAIENRLLGWLSGCKGIMKIFADGLDPYIMFATVFYNKPYDQVTKEERNKVKAVVLGCGFQLGGGEEVINSDGDLIKTGLLGYAAAMGTIMTAEEAARAVAVFRQEYKEVVDFWYALERAAIACIRQHEDQTVGKVTFVCHSKGMLEILLPSGRPLHYICPEVHKQVFTSKGNEYEKSVVSYMGVDQQTRQWTRIATRGGHWTENLCQSIARDILVHGMRLAEESGLPVIAHVHDEIVCEVPDEPSYSVQRLIDCMSAVPAWAKGLPLAAAGFESYHYRKD